MTARILSLAALAASGCIGSNLVIGTGRSDAGGAGDGVVAVDSAPAVVDAALPVDVPVVTDVPATPDRALPADLGPLPDVQGCEGASPPVGTACTVGTGACLAPGRIVCRPDLGVALCDAVPNAMSTETCNGLDDDCDGMIDEGLARGCYEGPAGTEGVGVCRGGMQGCVMGAWSACTAQSLPTAETCDNLDNNCDGAVDEGVTRLCGDLSWSMPERYTRAVTRGAFVDACAAPGRATVLAGVDDGASMQPLPFAFSAFGVRFSAVTLTPNGAMGFSGTPSFNNLALPASSVTNALFPYWDDLYMRAGVCVATTDMAPSRRFVVTWSDAMVFPRNDVQHMTFTAILEEATGVIEFRYGAMMGDADRTQGSQATIGIQGAGWADQLSYNMVVPNLSGTIVRWTPAPSAMRGICRAGTQTCAGGAWGQCAGEVRPMTREVCGNAMDDDCNGLTDEGCL
ncbi:MAG: MopE-related protein [Polyangiales bacterium]